MSYKRHEVIPRSSDARESLSGAGLEPSNPRDHELGHPQIEYTLKIPRSIDQRMAEELNERHKRFVEEEFKRFSLALSGAERLSSECKSSSRRSREDDLKSI